jgi:hypothetical protein
MPLIEFGVIRSGIANFLACSNISPVSLSAGLINCILLGSKIASYDVGAS